MVTVVCNYLSALVNRFGQGWNQFWFKPSDPYPLALIRISLGVLLLYLFATFSLDLERFIGPDGLVPSELVSDMRPVIFEEDGDRRLITIHPRYLSHLYHISSTEGLWIAHAIGAGILVLFTIGFKSRWTTILALLLTLSYMHRAPFITTEVDRIVCLLLFYLCFGQSGAYLSVDRWMANRRAARDPIFAKQLASKALSWGSTISLRLMQIHVTIIYLSMGLAKLSGPPVVPPGDGEWINPWQSGDAIWLLAARPEAHNYDLSWLASYPQLFQFWSLAVVLFELAFGILVWNRMARPLMLLIAFPMWGALALVSGIAPFCVAMLIASMAFFSRDMIREYQTPVDVSGETASTAAANA